MAQKSRTSNKSNVKLKKKGQKKNSNCCLTLTEMCKGAHKTHKRSGAQAQAKRLKPQNGIKELKDLNENGQNEERKVPGIV